MEYGRSDSDPILEVGSERVDLALGLHLGDPRALIQVHGSSPLHGRIPDLRLPCADVDDGGVKALGIGISRTCQARVAGVVEKGIVHRPSTHE